MSTIKIASRNTAAIEVGTLRAKRSADGTRILRYYVDIGNTLIKAHKEVSATDLESLQRKVNALVAQWDERTEQQKKKNYQISGRELADRETIEANEKLRGLQDLLFSSLIANNKVEWESLKDRALFRTNKIFIDAPPQRRDIEKPEFAPPKIGFFDRLFGGAKVKMRDADAAYAAAVDAWNQSQIQEDTRFDAEIAKYDLAKSVFEEEVGREKADFFARQVETNNKIDLIASGVASGDPDSIIEHANIVLDASDYGGMFEKDFYIDYNIASKAVLVDYELPSYDSLPNVKQVRFNQTTGELKKTYLSDKDAKSLYDSVCYQICLRTIYELIDADVHENVQQVFFNGYASFLDRATGRTERACIMSIMVQRDQIASIDLSRVDPKACFKSLKGISASSLAAMVPIAPVIKIDREDKRFIDPKGAIQDLDDATNLAAMDWEQFEHLVREVFEMEFRSRGGEVKVTQSSSDGGVDAVAFDPDPITGGKIVIQAKRYTKTVGVSAVRDLYGTMQHEGASRGILITTADYGPDAHRFSSGKPITLMSGSNLLYLLEKHGVRAKIDLREARKELALRG
ncbi:restriction endonuclease [Chthonobacter rhizosphaerae]|uniref:restriction endonuclease n=1 Tax=Chthonobacter rhizosphaerae TaxID=2735553 RepID=UPI0015EF0A75|nr:restriction endonuclease [Chthonobacter rhizosphaerae]